MARFKFHNDQVIAGLDIGSAFIFCAVATKTSDSQVELLSFNERPTKGLLENRVTHFNELIPVIGEVLEEAEEISKSSFSKVWLGFNPPFHSLISKGMAALPTREVTQKDVDIALNTACAVPIAPQHQIIHKIPQGFNVDGKGEVVNPIGLSGLRLETLVRLVTVSKFYCQDLTRVLKTLGCVPKGFIHNLIAHGEHLIDSRKKKEGCCFCDIGQKSSQFIVYQDNKIKHLFSLPIGEDFFTSALSYHFKIHGGTLQSNFVSEEEMIQGLRDDFFISKKIFAQALEKSASNFFKSIKTYVDSNELDKFIPAGFIFSGSISQLNGFLDQARLELGATVSHPMNLVSGETNLKRDKTFSLVKQAYAMERMNSQEHSFSLNLSKLKELF